MRCDVDEKLLKALKETSPRALHGIWGLGSSGYFMLDTGAREKPHSRAEVAELLIRRRKEFVDQIAIIQDALDSLLTGATSSGD